MAPERHLGQIQLTGIQIDLIGNVVTLNAADGRKAKLSFARPSESPPVQDSALLDSDFPDTAPSLEEEVWDDVPPSSTESVTSTDRMPESSPSPEKQQIVVLSGVLKTQPKEGQPDGQGRPTAWARLAVAEDSSNGDHFYSATFHRAAAPVALGLKKGARVTVEGYPHPGNRSRRISDRLSVIVLRDYPGKVPVPMEGRSE